MQINKDLQRVQDLLRKVENELESWEDCDGWVLNFMERIIEEVARFTVAVRKESTRGFEPPNDTSSLDTTLHDIEMDV